MNYIIMKNGKSKLLSALNEFNTIFVLIGTDSYKLNPEGTYTIYTNFQQLSNDFEMLKTLTTYDKVVFYSNESKEKAIMYTSAMNMYFRTYNTETIFMFGSE